MRVGVLGGTFDPVHLAHLIIAEECRLHLGLQEVIFIPAGRPWMKEGQKLSSAGDRINMVRLSIADNPWFKVSDMEVARDGLTYTVDTLRTLARRYQQDTELYFILGTDAFASFELWKDPQEILTLCTLAVVVRDVDAPCDFAKLVALSPRGKRSGVRVPAQMVDISATEIRARVQQGWPVRYQVHAEVERYIMQHGLYKTDGGQDEGS